MVDNILSAIELISAAAGSPESWDLALGGLVNLLNGDHAVMFGTESDMESGAIVARFGIDERDIECWSTPEAAQLAAPFNNNVPIGRAFASSELMPDRDWQRSVYYNELVRPLSGFYSVAVRQARSDCSFLMVVCRERRHGPFAEPEIDTMQRLLPHITTAVELGRRLWTTQAQSAGLARALDRLKTGVILTDAAGLPCFVNQRAAQILEQTDGLALSDTGLTTAAPRTTIQLREAIATLSADAGAKRTDLRINRPSGQRPLVLSLLPIWHLDWPAIHAPASRVVIFVREANAMDVGDPLVLAAAYSLTPRESEVGMMLASGLALDEIADRLSLSIETIRSHLKRVFDKTGTHSQAALVALLHGISSPCN